VTEEKFFMDAGEMDVFQKIAAIELWQNDPSVHPLTCGKDSQHSLLRPQINQIVRGGSGDAYAPWVVLQCPDCDYIQTNVPEAIFDRYNQVLYFLETYGGFSGLVQAATQTTGAQAEPTEGGDS
jgi:hypothetical protein